MTGQRDAVLAWLGLAIAIVVLNDFGMGAFARYTLIAVIVYALLTNVEQLSGLFNRTVTALGSATTPAAPRGGTPRRVQ